MSQCVQKELKPWRTSTAYEIFCKDERPNMRKQMPDASSRDINKALGFLWADCSKAKKQEYKQQASKHKEKATKDLKLIEKKLGLKFKKSVCAYSLFVKDFRNKTRTENLGMTHISVMQEISKSWNDMPQDQRKKYDQLAKIDFERY